MERLTTPPAPQDTEMIQVPAQVLKDLICAPIDQRRLQQHQEQAMSLLASLRKARAAALTRKATHHLLLHKASAEAQALDEDIQTLKTTLPIDLAVGSMLEMVSPASQISDTLQKKIQRWAMGKLKDFEDITVDLGEDRSPDSPSLALLELPEGDPEAGFKALNMDPATYSALTADTSPEEAVREVSTEGNEDETDPYATLVKAYPGGF